jgi:hypothetical protein
MDLGNLEMHSLRRNDEKAGIFNEIERDVKFRK